VRVRMSMRTTGLLILGGVCIKLQFKLLRVGIKCKCSTGVVAVGFCVATHSWVKAEPTCLE
jgi:hypothetical protein